MTDHDEQRLVIRLAGVAEVFGKTLSRAALQGYVRALRDLALPSIEHALLRCERECRYFPTPHDIRQRLGSDGPTPRRPALPAPADSVPLTRAGMSRILRDVGRMPWMRELADDIERRANREPGSDG